MKKSKAFSLFEISIVIIIISILMVGVLQSKNIIRKAKITNARALTVSSVVKDIGDLVLWYEATLEKSFIKEEAIENHAISIWYDLNPEITTIPNNATQSTSVNRPVYLEDGINKLPALNFNRSNSNFLSFNGESLEHSSFTVFVVEQRTANHSDNYFIGGGASGDNANLIVGYEADDNFTFAMISNGLDTEVDSYSQPEAKIHSLTFNFTEKKYYLNGQAVTLTSSGSAPDATAAIASFTPAFLGANTATSSYYQGNIGEVIMFKKFLTSEERKSVESYLGKKWNITLVD